jgi:hypothetical protein
MHLKTPDGQSAVVVGGSVPPVHDGWMWDLTVPGNNDHDFYVLPSAHDNHPTQRSFTGSVAVLVHNVGCDEWAAKEAAKNGGDVQSFTGPAGDKYPLGPYRPEGPGTPEVDETWFHHTVVVRDGEVFDQWHPHGVGIDEYQQMWDYSEDIDFGF